MNAPYRTPLQVERPARAVPVRVYRALNVGAVALLKILSNPWRSDVVLVPEVARLVIPELDSHAAACLRCIVVTTGYRSVRHRISPRRWQRGLFTLEGQLFAGCIVRHDD